MRCPAGAGGVWPPPHRPRQASPGVARDRQHPCGEEVEMVLRSWDRCAADGRGQRLGEHDAGREPDPGDRQRARPPSAHEQQRARAEQPRRQQPPCEVVDAEGGIAPAGRCTPGERGRRGGVREQRPRPRGQLWSTPCSPPSRQLRGEPEGDERCRESQQSVHGGSVVSVATRQGVRCRRRPGGSCFLADIQQLMPSWTGCNFAQRWNAGLPIGRVPSATPADGYPQPNWTRAAC